ncbi:MAG: TatD family hydrolase [Treponema sp.]|jgi:TatD DNase family protein|nr:TatD family hydrolase [Treponema sp.]
MIDTHAHLSMLARRGIDAETTLAGLFGTDGPGSGGAPGKLRGIIDVSLSPGDLPARVEAFSRYSRVRFASGLWPHRSSVERRSELVPALEKEIRSAPPGLVCALGEFGLDRHRDGDDSAPDPSGERELMEMQLELARRLALPVIIHSRDAPEETAEILGRYGDVRGVIHCFSYSRAELSAFLDRGYFISFAGNLSYKNAGAIRDACGFVPGGRLLLETDCPYLAPVPFRGKPADPGMVAENYRLAAELRGTSVEALAEQIAANVEELFGVRWQAVP